MTIKDLQEEMKISMKNKNKIKTLVIKDIIGTAKNIAIDKKSEVTEDIILDALSKAKKVYKDQIDNCPESREDNLKEYKERLFIVESYLPKQLTEKEVWAKITELTIGKEFKNVGEIMKVVMPVLKGKADGKVINKVAREFISKGE
jgi:uncharacterized protein YqeY